jgi:hypothetical protein
MYEYDMKWTGLPEKRILKNVYIYSASDSATMKCPGPVWKYK